MNKIYQTLLQNQKKDKKKYVGEEFNQCKYLSSLYYTHPFDRGYLLNWEVQTQILNIQNTYKTHNHKFDPSTVDILLTEPPFNPNPLKKLTAEHIFEHYEFNSLFVTTGPMLSMFNYKYENYSSPFAFASSCIVVDSGYSFTHIVPFFDNHIINHAVKRIDVGGKLLTNYLKEIISFRYYNMMEETYIINTIKERLCFVSEDFARDLRITKLRGLGNTIKREYVLPDYSNSLLGYIKGENPSPTDTRDTNKPSEDQVLVMNNERICIPEILFNPSDIGIKQAGIPEAIVQAVECCVTEMREELYGNILLMGGSTLFTGYQERLYNELRKLVPQQYQVNLYTPKDLLFSACRGGSNFARQDYFSKFAISREEYREDGIRKWL